MESGSGAAIDADAHAPAQFEARNDDGDRRPVRQQSDVDLDVPPTTHGGKPQPAGQVAVHHAHMGWRLVSSRAWSTRAMGYYWDKCNRRRRRIRAWACIAGRGSEFMHPSSSPLSGMSAGDKKGGTHLFIFP